MPKNIQDWLSWLIKLRIVAMTTLLGVIVGVDESVGTISTVPNTHTGSGLLTIILISYAVSAVHYFLLRLDSRYQWQAYFQTGCDLAIIFAILHRTGGIESSFSFLYLLSIIMASILLYRRGAFVTASLSSLLVGISFFWSLSGNSMVVEVRTLRIIGFDVLAFYAVAYLSSYLSESLKRTGNELEHKSGKLADLQAIHQNIINSMRGGLLTTNLDGFITIFNQSASEITGFAPERVIGTHVEVIFGSIPKHKITLIRNQQAVRFEKTIQGLDGREIYLGMSVSPLRLESHQQIGHVYAFQDLTEVKLLEKQIKQRDRMATIGKMAAGIAHEIRNPLTAISGSFHILKSDLVLNEEQKGLIDNISLEIKRLYKTTTDFLTYARPLNFSPKLVDLRQMTSDTLELIRHSPDISDQHQIQCSYDPNHPLYCRADPDLLKQVFWNLCNNAIKAMPDGGVLSIDIQDAGGAAVAIRFSDTGTGLTPEEQERIFEPFQSSFSNGTGLGLSIVSQIVDAHQGSIEVSSSEGQGASFQILLPKERVNA